MNDKTKIKYVVENARALIKYYDEAETEQEMQNLDLQAWAFIEELAFRLGLEGGLIE